MAGGHRLCSGAHGLALRSSVLSAANPALQLAAPWTPLRWMAQYRSQWEDPTVITRHLRKLKRAHKEGRGEGLHDASCSTAARVGRLDLLKYARKKGCDWDEFTCRRAAEGGHLHVLKYAHENGCPWDRFACTKAAKAGHLEVLKYLHENGCPCS